MILFLFYMGTNYKKVCGIYLITNNLNGMSYVGQSQNCDLRWTIHKKPSANYSPIDKAINEFGAENFTFKILLECPPDMLDVWERDMINLHNTLYPNGYNRQDGGRDGFYKCEETRRKMSERQIGEKNHMYGKHLSEEARRKIGESLKGRVITEETRRKMIGDKNPSKRLEVRRKISETKKGKQLSKYKWLTPNGEIREMSAHMVSHWHKDWIRLTEE